MSQVIDAAATAAQEAQWRERAQGTVLCDLVNALLHENLLGIADKGRISGELPEGVAADGLELDAGEQWLQLELNEGSLLVFRVRRHLFIQPYKISRLPVLLLSLQEEGGMAVTALEPIGLMLTLADAATAEERSTLLPNLAEFLTELRDAIEQGALSLAVASQAEQTEESSGSLTMLAMERMSAWRDRPFHPTSRAKRGWNLEEYSQYSPEFGRTFALAWVAVRRDYLQQGQHAGEIAPYVLGADEIEQLLMRMADAGVYPDEYLAMPVHPWQFEQVLPDVYRAEIERRIVVPLPGRVGQVAATSSLRALSPADGGPLHVKVPIGIYSLAALRILPPRYLHNAEQAQAVLAEVAAGEPLLGNLHLCNEEAWWGFHDPAGDAFADKPGHLACLIREYPQHLLAEDRELVAMSTLAVVSPAGRVPAVEQLLKARFGVAEAAGTEPVIELFADIARSFLTMALTCFRYGLMPEVHGQNVMLSFAGGQVGGILLRDHDTIRLYLPWLEREGFRDPGYIVKPGTPNSLVNRTPQALLSYLQTLGIQVNLYAIMDALSRVYGIDEMRFWQEIRQAVEAVLGMEGWPEDVRAVIEQQLLQAQTWPTRTLIAPLLKRVGSGGGSMPADTGETGNPLLPVRG